MQINYVGFLQSLSMAQTQTKRTHMWRIVSAKWSLLKRWDPQIVHTISVSSPPLIKTIHSPNSVIKINISQQIIDAHELLCVFKKKDFLSKKWRIPLRCLFPAECECCVEIFLQVLRLICIQSYCNNGLKTKVLDYYKREIIQVCVI